MAKYAGFCGPSYVSQSPLAGVERCVNFYPERIAGSPMAKVDVVLYPTPGLRAFAAASETPGRGMFAQSGRCFSVIGNKFYEVFTGGTLTLRGTVLVDNFPATMTTNGDLGNQIFITSGDDGYIYDMLTHTFTGVVSDVSMGVMLNARFLALDANTSTLKSSGLGNGLTWNPLHEAQRSAASDPWRALALTSSKEIWILGEQTGEVWYDAGLSGFPFAPRAGILITPGIAAAHTLKELNGAMVWLSHSKDGDGQIVRAAGYSAVPISTHAVDLAIKQYAMTVGITDAVAYTYQDEGHNFYVINFPSAGRTWVYDDTTNWWHERGQWDGATGDYLAWSPQYHAHEFGKHLVSDFRSGTIYDMATTAYQDAGGLPMRRMRVVPGVPSNRKRVYYDSLEIVFEPGLGVSVGQGVSPQAWISKSDNAGKTWGSERWRTAGAQGKYLTRSIWKNLGSARERAHMLVMSDPVIWRIVDAQIDARAG